MKRVSLIIGLILFSSLLQAQENISDKLHVLFSTSKEIYGDSALLYHNQNTMVLSLGDFTDETQWNLHKQAMYAYFEKGSPKKVNALIFLRNNLHKTEVLDRIAKKDSVYLNLTFVFIGNENTELFPLFNYDTTSPANTNIVLVVSKDGLIQKRIDNYNCQGEKLKEIEYACFPEHFSNAGLLKTDSLIVGQVAPLALIGDSTRWTGISVVSFFPAWGSMTCSVQTRDFSHLFSLPYTVTISGQFKSPVFVDDHIITEAIVKHANAKNILMLFSETIFLNLANNIADMNRQPVSVKAKSPLKVVMVSSSSTAIPDGWAGTKKNKNFVSLADTTGKISAGFGSLSKLKDGGYYSSRTVFLVDKKGVLRYVNYNYDVKRDLAALKAELKKIN